MARVGMLFRSGARRGLSCPRRCGTVRSEGPGGQGSSASPCARDMRLRWTEACGKHSLSSPDAGGRSRLLVSNRRLVQHSSNPAVVTAGHLRKRAGASGWFLTTPCSPPQLRASVFPSQPRSWARSARQHGAEQRDVLVPCHPKGDGVTAVTEEDRRYLKNQQLQRALPRVAVPWVPRGAVQAAQPLPPAQLSERGALHPPPPAQHRTPLLAASRVSVYPTHVCPGHTLLALGSFLWQSYVLQNNGSVNQCIMSRVWLL
ncbi:uncharacterized protein [Patagioenas fasciata]|uniref:uncharacterized protein isoform X2 n=1 Tax=Patagioenas fasciata TaxID=372321 RepID=UPI003A99066E